MHASPAALLASLLMLLHAFMSILVVYAPHLGVGEDIVRFGYIYKFLRRCVVVGVLVGVILFREGAVGFLYLPLVCVFR